MPIDDTEPALAAILQVSKHPGHAQPQLQVALCLLGLTQSAQQIDKFAVHREVQRLQLQCAHKGVASLRVLVSCSKQPRFVFPCLRHLGTQRNCGIDLLPRTLVVTDSEIGSGEIEVCFRMRLHLDRPL